jgi:hypothetical protein
MLFILRDWRPTSWLFSRLFSWFDDDDFWEAASLNTSLLLRLFANWSVFS